MELGNHKQDALDAVLSSEEPLMPSSGFLASVMERVEEQSTAPQPISFPWKRILPAIIGAAAAFVLILVIALPELWQSAADSAWQPAQLPSVPSQPLMDAAWIALALAVSLASWLFSRRLAGVGSRF